MECVELRWEGLNHKQVRLPVLGCPSDLGTQECLDSTQAQRREANKEVMATLGDAGKGGGVSAVWWEGCQMVSEVHSRKVTQARSASTAEEEFSAAL